MVTLHVVIMSSAGLLLTEPHVPFGCLEKGILSVKHTASFTYEELPASWRRSRPVNKLKCSYSNGKTTEFFC